MTDCLACLKTLYSNGTKQKWEDVMGVRVLKRWIALFGIGCILVAVSSGCATTQPGRLRMKPEEVVYYDQGVAAADSVYTSALPIFAGYVTGIVAPVPFSLSPALIIGGPIIGAAVALAAGNKAIDYTTQTTPAELTEGFSEQHRNAFEGGYSDRVKELRKSRYGVGVIAGVLTDIILVAQALSGLSGFS